MQGDSRMMQITAPVQSGSSDGPVIDLSGRIVGIVTSKLNAQKLEVVSGNLSENVGFAIKAGIIKNFLDSQQIEYIVRPFSNSLETTALAEKRAGGSLSRSNVGAENSRASLPTSVVQWRIRSQSLSPMRDPRCCDHLPKAERLMRTIRIGSFTFAVRTTLQRITAWPRNCLVSSGCTTRPEQRTSRDAGK